MKKIIRALASVPSLLTAGTAGLLAVALHSWPIAALGVAACAALAAADAAKSGKRGLPASTLPPPGRLEDPHTAHAVRAILAAREELEKALAATHAAVTPMLAPVADLDARATKLVSRAEDIALHLQSADFGALEREVDHLAARIPTTSDATTRASYVAALEARRGHLETLHELVRTKERIGATLLSIAATLDGLPAKVVRLRGQGDATSDVGRDLAQMNDEIASFEETLLSVCAE